MNEYAQITDFKAHFGYSTDTAKDAWIKDCLTWASRELNRHRFFYEKSETRKFNCPDEGRALMFETGWPLLSLTTLTNGNGSTISSSDYFLYPDPNNPPYMWLELDESGSSVWEYATTPQQAIQVAGLWGWHEEYDDAWEASGATVSDNPLTSSATTLTPSAITEFDDQQMLKVGSEQIYVSSAGTSDLTVSRGKNGTTAAEHASGAAISIYRPQHEVKMVTLRLAYWREKQKDAAFETTGHKDLGIVTVPASIPKDLEYAILKLNGV